MVSKKDTPVSAMRAASTADAAMVESPAAAPEVDDGPGPVVESGAATGPESAPAPDAEPAPDAASGGDDVDADHATVSAGDVAVEEGGRGLGTESDRAEVTVEDPRMERVDADNDDNPPTPIVPPFMSEGVRQDLELVTEVLDPMSGGVFRRDPDSGRLTFTPKGGGEEIEVK